MLWPVLGIKVPVELRTLHVLLSPSIEIHDKRDCLVIRLRIEEADVAWLPSSIDATIKDRVNKELADKHIELAWGFGKTLSVRFALPKVLRSADAMALDVTRGRAGVSGDALEMAVAFAPKVFARTGTH